MSERWKNPMFTSILGRDSADQQKYTIPVNIEDCWNEDRTRLRITYRQARRFAGQRNNSKSIHAFHNGANPEISIEKDNVTLIKEDYMYYFVGKEEDIYAVIDKYELRKPKYY